MSLSDLRGKPCILIGAFDNAWTLSLAGELRFYFDEDPARHAQIIRDRRNPKQMSWELVEGWPPTNRIKTDYALVTRVMNRTTEKTVVSIAGITQYGTEAAAEFVTNPDYFKRALTHAPSDWSHKNIQVVLSTRVISQTSGLPRWSPPISGRSFSANASRQHLGRLLWEFIFSISRIHKMRFINLDGAKNAP